MWGVSDAGKERLEARPGVSSGACAREGGGADLRAPGAPWAGSQEEEVARPPELVEAREGYSKTAHVKSRAQYDEMYKRSVEDPAGFWGDIAREFHWDQPWKLDVPIFESNFDVRKGPIQNSWFPGGRTNIAYNCLDLNIKKGRGDWPAILWEGNGLGEDAQLTYQETLDLVCQIANWLKKAGVKKGDRVILYMPMLAELPAAMLACMRIGAVHAVVFAGFSADSLAERILASKAKVVLTCSGVMRGAKLIALKQIVDDALKICKDKEGYEVDHCAVYENKRALAAAETSFTEGRDVWWHDAVPPQSKDCPVEWVDSEDPSFMLYTSGSTGKPKGVQHCTGGYMVYAATTVKYVFNTNPGDVYWCTADCGWITGHTYLTYGPLLNGLATVVFEGVPTYPDAGRCWQVVEKYKVKQFYTAPTAVRALMRSGDSFVTPHDRSSLDILGSVGEPINPEAWRWYHVVVGGGRCPISDTWWQTETGGNMITPLPGAWPQKPGAASLPFFGVQPVVLDPVSGAELEGEAEGVLCIKSSWPSVLRTLYEDQERYEQTYFSDYKGYYFSGDGCRRDKDGYFWITGRVDDVINVSGHRIGTAEVESALVLHDACAEAAVVGYEHPIKGQGIYAYVTLMEGKECSDDLKKALVQVVRAKIGAFAAPDVIHWAPGLPKTRSGKIMRRILRKIADNKLDELGDTSTLSDPSVVDTLISLRPERKQ